MVKLGKSTTEDLQGAIDRALTEGRDDEGVTQAINRMVAERIVTLNELASQTLTTTTPPEDEGVVIYDELPPGLIDLPSASKKYGIKNDTLRHWVYQGNVEMVARLKGPTPGGGYKVVKVDDLEAYIKAPRRKPGPPKKRHK